MNTTGRRWVMWVAVAALLGGLVFAGGQWAVRHITATSQNSQSAAISAGQANATAQELQRSATQRSQEIAILQQEVKDLQAGTAEEAVILQLAGMAISQFDQQLKAICTATPGCVQTPFDLPTSTTTTTVPAPSSTTTTRPATTTTAAPRALVTATTSTTATTRPRHGAGRGHGHRPGGP